MKAGGQQPFSGSLVASLLCVALIVAAEQVHSSDEPTLEAVCDDRPVSLTRISTARSLIEQNRLLKKPACGKYENSLEELDDILATVQSGRTCDLVFVDKIQQYHENFIASTGSQSRPQDSIPKALRHFFISLCFQISAECKMALINNLEYDTKEKLTDADYDEIKFLENTGATLFDTDAEISDFDDILLLNDLNQAAGLEEQTGESKLLIKVRTNKMMRKLVENCNKKFKPFYDKLIMPLIKLSNLGYNYQGELLEREMKELKRNKLVLRWYNIVQTCEAFRTIQIFEDPEPLELSNGCQPFTFISGEVAENLRQRNVKTIEEEINEQEIKEGASNEPIVYEPIASHNDDELWIKDQSELENLVRKYRASLSVADRVRSKLFKKLIAKVKGAIMSGKVPMLATELVRSGFGGQDEKKTTSVNDEMIMMMDEAVRQEEQEANSSQVAPYSLEAPVAGLKTVGKRKIVSKVGPVSYIKAMGVPPRTEFIPVKKDGTKTSLKLFNFGAKFLPRRMNIFMWILAISGFLMIIVAVFTG